MARKGGRFMRRPPRWSRVYETKKENQGKIVIDGLVMGF